MIKIADFGLSVNTESKDYFRMNDSERRAFPIRWMAPESIMEGKYDEKTDVVSTFLSLSFMQIILTLLVVIWSYVLGSILAGWQPLLCNGYLRPC